MSIGVNVMAGITLPSEQLRCGQMAQLAAEYCSLIEWFGDEGLDGHRLERLKKLLPKLHMAVISLVAPQGGYRRYFLPDDEARFELYMRLHHTLRAEPQLWSAERGSLWRAKLCDHLADDLTDMYFDLKQGLDRLVENPTNPEHAIHDWLCSFYMHWGPHLLDAEHWLHAKDKGRPVKDLYRSHYH
jgi:hypothetical protein